MVRSVLLLCLAVCCLGGLVHAQEDQPKLIVDIVVGDGAPDEGDGDLPIAQSSEEEEGDVEVEILPPDSPESSESRSSSKSGSKSGSGRKGRDARKPKRGGPGRMVDRRGRDDDARRGRLGGDSSSSRSGQSDASESSGSSSEEVRDGPRLRPRPRPVRLGDDAEDDASRRPGPGRRDGDRSVRRGGRDSSSSPGGDRDSSHESGGNRRPPPPGRRGGARRPPPPGRRGRGPPLWRDMRRG